MKAKKEELRELYRKMPIEEFAALHHKNLKNYVEEAIEVIKEVAKEREDEINKYYLNQQKEHDKKVYMAKEKWADIKRKYNIFKITGWDRKLEKGYNKLASSVSFYLTEYYRESYIMRDFRDILGTFFDLPTIDDFIQKLEEFDVILDNKLEKNKKGKK